MTTQSFDVAVIGGGIAGLAHAWMSVRRGLRTALFERTSVAEGASVRNFGMIWPIGQPAGELYPLALRSRAFWLELQSQGVLEVEQCGSIHVAHREDELAVLEEFCDQQTHQASLLSAQEVIRHSSLVNPAGLLGGLLSTTELRVNPRSASVRLANWLADQGVECFFSTPINRVEDDRLYAADEREFLADRTIICSGSDLQTLCPEVLRDSGLQLCKLQMLRSVPQRRALEGTPHLASGLTLRHYSSFNKCPSHAALRARISAETPELDRFGIHVMAAPFPNGEIILGDSHEYGQAITPFDNAQIDELILRELRKIIQLDDWTIKERWHGVYAKHPELPVFEFDQDNLSVFVGPGGAGMTLSFALADRAWQRWFGESE